MVSAFAGGYQPIPGSVMGALSAQLGISVIECEKAPEFDLRGALGIWLSKPLVSERFKRLLCVEIVGGDLPLSDAVENVFAGLMLFDAKGIATQTIALPLLGAGHQQLEPGGMAALLVPRIKKYLEVSPNTARLVLVEIDSEKAVQLGDAIENYLGRSKVTLPRMQLVNALTQDVLHRLKHAESLFAPDCLAVRDEWMRLLSAHDVRAIEFGIHSRKLVELILARLDCPQQVLSNRIRELEKRGEVAPWICGYMNILRHLGNDSAHQSVGETLRDPPLVAADDLTAGLFCIQRLLEFWIDRDARRRASAIA